MKHTVQCRLNSKNFLQPKTRLPHPTLIKLALQQKSVKLSYTLCIWTCGYNTFDVITSIHSFSDPIPEQAKQEFHVQGGERGCHGRSIVVPVKRTRQRYCTSSTRCQFHQHSTGAKAGSRFTLNLLAHSAGRTG